MKIGQKIKQLREEREWSQEQLATLMGYKSKSSINKIELGINDIPQSKILAFAKIFEISPADLLMDADQAQDEDTLASEVHLWEEIQKRYGRQAVEMLKMFTALNSNGMKKALEAVEPLTEIPRYLKG